MKVISLDPHECNYLISDGSQLYTLQRRKDDSAPGLVLNPVDQTRLESQLFHHLSQER